MSFDRCPTESPFCTDARWQGRPSYERTQTRQLRRAQCSLHWHFCGLRRPLMSSFTSRLIISGGLLFPFEVKILPVDTDPRHETQVSLNCWTRLKDAMHYSWMCSVWIPGVAFLFGFQGKHLQFNLFLRHIDLIIIDVSYSSGGSN